MFNPIDWISSGWRHYEKNIWGHDCMEKVRLEVEKLAWAMQEVE